MNGDLEPRLREVFHEDAAHARFLNPDRPADTDARSLPVAPSPSRPSRRLVAVAAAAIALIATAGTVSFANNGDGETEVSTSPDPADTSPSTTASTTTTLAAGFRALPPILARADAVKIRADGFGVVDGSTLNLVAVEEYGMVTGEFRFDKLVVTIQCADTRRMTAIGARRDLILGGVLTDNPDGLATIDGVEFEVGDRLALIIREGDGFGQRVTLYGPTFWDDENATAESCEELAKSVPLNMDGGMFNRLKAGYGIETTRLDPRVL